MATCKDCIHYDICIFHHKGNENEQCLNFKNKADVVPVVKCSQCRKRYTTECALWFSQLDNNQYFCGAIHNDDFYCGYGERE